MRIALDPGELAEHPLRIGLSMRVEVDTRDRSGALLAGEARKEAGHSTGVFLEPAREADLRIARVIAANRAAGKQ